MFTKWSHRLNKVKNHASNDLIKKVWNLSPPGVEPGFPTLETAAITLKWTEICNIPWFLIGVSPLAARYYLWEKTRECPRLILKNEVREERGAVGWASEKYFQKEQRSQMRRGLHSEIRQLYLISSVYHSEHFGVHLTSFCSDHQFSTTSWGRYLYKLCLPQSGIASLLSGDNFCSPATGKWWELSRYQR